MDIRAYFDDVRKIEAELRQKNQSEEVHVTSVFHRERNSTPGSTMSATVRNAARVIADGTHREATKEEVKGFLDRQQQQLEDTTRSEQARRNKEYIVLTGPRPLLSEMVKGGPSPAPKNS